LFARKNGEGLIMMSANRNLILLFTSCTVAWLLASATLRAQHPGRILSEPAYRELRQ
jgi:hypothetical protein